MTGASYRLSIDAVWLASATTALAETSRSAAETADDRLDLPARRRLGRLVTELGLPGSFYGLSEGFRRWGRSKLTLALGSWFERWTWAFLGESENLHQL